MRPHLISMPAACALAIFLLAFLALPNATQAQAQNPSISPPARPLIQPEWAMARLKNGMDIFVLTDRRAPIVTHMLWYRIGASDEATGKSGIAHLFEHLMFRGTKNIPDGEFAKRIAALGGQSNAFTAHDYTAYFARIGVDALGTIMDMEADRIRHLQLNETILAAEKNIVLEERAMRTDSDPSALLMEAMRKRLYRNHPYHIPIIGWRDEIENLTIDDARDFFQKFYSPDNAILVIVGDVDMAHVLPLAEKFYSPLAAQNQPRPQRTAPLTIESAQYMEAKDARATLRQWARLYRLDWPHALSERQKDEAALDVLMAILAGDETSRLYREIVIEQKLASYIGGYAATGYIDAGYTHIYSTPQDGVDMTTLARAIEATLNELKKNPVSEVELAQAKTTLQAGALYSWDSQFQMARIFGVTLTLGGLVQDVIDWPQRIANVSADDVQRVARHYLRHKESVTGVLLPQTETETETKASP